MTEVSGDFPRVWVEFTDPQDSDRRFRCDLTWLTSRWQCIFGAGCAGILADRPDDGCCSLGAHFSDQDDESRVSRWSRKLPASMWQYRELGRRLGISRSNDEGETHTRLVDGACVFLNRPGFSGAVGCALHLWATERGIPTPKVKPDVCWQLPIRRTYDTSTGPNGEDRQVVIIGEYDRAGWGPGGCDLDWYCSGNTDAHMAPVPVFVSERPVLIELMGLPAYDELVACCRAHLATLESADDSIRQYLAPHPAD
ncbi:MAG: hypothetical protein Q8P61_08540 [Candidatus Nanopelagicales bacterium]|nr:hypothetical protein [Candidatus Nanopelagicales bacterium]